MQEEDRSDPLGDALLAQLEAILLHDIPDPNRSRAVAMIMRAHMRALTVRVVREKLDPYIGSGAGDVDCDALVRAMRDIVVVIAGYDPSYRWEAPRS